MDPLELLSTLRKRWKCLVVALVVSLLGAAAFTLAQVPTYSATTRLFFAVPGGESVSDLAQGSSFTERQMSSYAQVAKSPIVLQGVVDELDLELTAQEVGRHVQVEVPENTVILQITASASSAEHAALVANAVGAKLTETVAELYPERADGAEAVLVTTLSPAVQPTSPSSPSIRRNLALGVLLGLVAGVGLALLRDMTDTRLRSAEAVGDITTRPILGSVGFDAETAMRPIALVDAPGGVRAEAIRRIRTNLQFVGLARDARTLLITSSISGEGKTTTALNLAVALADTGARVALVDADLRRPSLARITGLEGGAGLTSVLIGRATPLAVIQPWRGGLVDVLTAGPLPPNPSELLGSSQMTEALRSLRETYDVVILDSPPLLPVTDASVLSATVDGTIVVVGADRTHRAQLRSALAELEALGVPILGIVVNRVNLGRRDAYGTEYAYAPVDEGLGKRRRPSRGPRHGFTGDRPAAPVADPGRPNSETA